MARPRVLILRAPGTNCDQESAYAFEIAGGQPNLVHVNRLLENQQLLSDYQILCLPGGFSYGDDVAAGRILGNQIRRRLDDAMQKFKSAEKLILGICNGFQVLIKSGLLLPDEQPGKPSATLTWNDSGKYEDRWVRLTTTSDKSVFLRDVKSMYLPVAHAEGKFVAQHQETLDRLAMGGQLALRYVASGGKTSNGSQVAYPANPNGSMRNVAGVCDSTGRVLGLMPHPERYIDPTHHPRWTRGEASDPGEGLKIFQNGVQFFA